MSQRRSHNPERNYIPVGDWTYEEAKLVEVALAHHFNDADKWSKIAARLPRRSAHEVYMYVLSLQDDLTAIEMGTVSPPDYQDNSLNQCHSVKTPEPSLLKKAKTDASEQNDRRKGVPWSQEEHHSFLLGLAKFGKGDWRNIARNFVTSRTPTQVASHAQKYFIRLNNNVARKDTRRASIHDSALDEIDTSMATSVIPFIHPPMMGGGRTVVPAKSAPLVQSGKKDQQSQSVNAQVCTGTNSGHSNAFQSSQPSAMCLSAALSQSQLLASPVNRHGKKNLVTPSSRNRSLVVAQASNPIGVHALVWTGAWEEADCRLAVSKSAKLDFDIVEIPLLEPDTVDAAMTSRVLQEHGIKAACSLGLRFDADISSADKDIAARGEELLNKALKVSAGMGAGYMCGVIYSALGKYPAPPTVQGRKNCVAALQRLADKAADGGITLGLECVNRYETNLLNTASQALELLDEGITLGLECVNRYETNLLNTASQALELLDEVNKPNVLVHLDTYHMNIEEGDENSSGKPMPLARAVKLCGSKLGYVHIGESNRGYLGTGNIDFDQMFEALAEINYKGPITFESFSSRVVSPALSNTLCVWRDLWADSEDLASSAKSYMDVHWKQAQDKQG
eukprot:gene17960-24365_t